MDFINPESAGICRKKAWDEENKCYYLVYFNKEQKIINRSINSRKTPITRMDAQKFGQIYN
jgi:hypothetical protein